MVLDSFFDAIFGWVIEPSPLWGLLVVSLILTFFVTLVYKFMTDQEALKSIKQEMKDIRKEMKQFKDDPEKVMELNKRSMEKSMTQMKNSFKPMLITFVPLIIIFGWLRNTYEGVQLNFLGFIDGWLWVYLIFSMLASIILRKLMKVH
ncbi:EMC3/TMCO1 family protein [archaeon]|nr:EMC3/TMCO1 family protein [archaeon]